MEIKFIYSKDSEEERVMHSISDNINNKKFASYSEVNDVLKNS